MNFLKNLKPLKAEANLKLLSKATKDPNFIFDETLYKPIECVTMGSPLGPALAKAFLVYHEKNWLQPCRLEHRPFYY